ncbi:MAG: lipopolysaccharide heptosyltransferase II [Acidobacteriota bacterium]
MQIKDVEKFDPARIKMILIRVNNWIGDVVMISPAMRSIREHFSNAKVSILARSWVVETLKGNPFYDELIEYDNLGMHRGLTGRWRLIQELKERKFDLAILFQKAFEAAFLSFLAGVPLRVGYDTDRRGFFLSHKIHETTEARMKHHVEYFLDIARFIGCDIKDKNLYFHFGEEERKKASEILGKEGLPGKDAFPVVVINPGASKPERRWHYERFAELADRLNERLGARIVLTGGNVDREGTGKILAKMTTGSKALDLTGKISIKEFGALLEKSSLFIGNDSGPMHVAAAVGAPVVAIFGPGIPEKTAPFVDAPRYLAITKKFSCAPCRQDFFKECSPAPSGRPYCIEEISVDEVFEASALLLSRSFPGSQAAAFKA